jgi:hypothetical protein
MKKFEYCLLVLFVGVMMSLCCSNEEEVNAWTGTDPDVETDTEVDGTDSFGTGVVPTSFKVLNETNTDRYILTVSPLRFQQHEGDVQTARQFFPLSCQFLCSEVEKGENCAIECAPGLPEVRLIRPSESYIFDWDGVIYEENEDHCGEGTCQESMPAPGGNYMVEIAASKGYVCEYEPCSGSDLISGAVLSKDDNDLSGYSTEFSIPHTAEEVVIKIVE